MKKILILFFLLFAVRAFTQSSKVDSLKNSIDDPQSNSKSIENRLASTENDVSKLKKIKISGYVQAQYEYYDKAPKPVPDNTFFIRRARLKTSYETSAGLKYVVESDFSTGNITVKDAYAVVNDPWLKVFSLTMGQFCRPDYEVEYSSGTREVLEYSKVITSLYPGEREIGAKFEAKPKSLPILCQLAVFNGNFTGIEPRDFDNGKDIMARAVYSYKTKTQNMGIDFGLNYYFGSVRTKDSKYVLNTDNSLDSVGKIGDNLRKKWLGTEFRWYSNFLGGIAVKAEYIFGQNAFLGVSTPSVSQAGGTATTTFSNGTTTVTTTGQSSTTKVVVSPNKLRNFSGFYVYLLKTINAKNQFALRYDSYDPNSKLSGDKAGSDTYLNTICLALNHFFDENIRITLAYTMPISEVNSTNKATVGKNLFGNNDVLNNTISLRVQAKF